MFPLLSDSSHVSIPIRFIQLLHILSEESNADAIQWLPHGLAFIILDRHKLITQVLPKYFDDTIKFTSFTRKLKRWQFVRIPTGEGDAAFYNKVRYTVDSIVIMIVEYSLSHYAL